MNQLAKQPSDQEWTLTERQSEGPELLAMSSPGPDGVSFILYTLAACIFTIKCVPFVAKVKNKL